MVGRFLGTVVVTLHGTVDLLAAGALAELLHDLIDAQGNLAVVVDLRDVGWIDGAGVGVLASAAQRLEARGGELRLGGPRPPLAEALAVSGLGALVSIPFEAVHTPSAPGGWGADGARRAGMDAHPAGTARHYQEKGRTG